MSASAQAQPVHTHARHIHRRCQRIANGSVCGGVCAAEQAGGGSSQHSNVIRVRVQTTYSFHPAASRARAKALVGNAAVVPAVTQASMRRSTTRHLVPAQRPTAQGPIRTRPQKSGSRQVSAALTPPAGQPHPVTHQQRRLVSAL